MTFIDRLVQAAKHAGVGERQSDIAASLQVKRQTVNRWFVIGGTPEADLMFHIANRYGVDPKWLKSGDGTMLAEPSEELPADERELLRNYRSATTKVREVIRSMARAARKVVVAVPALAIPPLMSPPADASAAIFHNQNLPIIHIGQFVRSLLSRLTRWMCVYAPSSMEYTQG